MIDPRCTCGGDPHLCGVEGRRYLCASCRLLMPWCFGASDDMPDVCDDCWALARAMENR